jgi:AcrR family transcriptional regulator
MPKIPVADTGTEPPAGTDERIDKALMRLCARGGTYNHDMVAEEAGVSRRTVYRRFADQKALRAHVWQLLSPPAGMPDDRERLLGGGLYETFRNFEAKAEEMTVVMASPEGRAMRNDRKQERERSYRAMFGESVAALDAADATAALAVIQLLGSGLAWREMRDQWDLDADAMGRAATWAIKALMADLEQRGSRPLDA